MRVNDWENVKRNLLGLNFWQVGQFHLELLNVTLFECIVYIYELEGTFILTYTDVCVCVYVYRVEYSVSCDLFRGFLSSRIDRSAASSPLRDLSPHSLLTPYSGEGKIYVYVTALTSGGDVYRRKTDKEIIAIEKFKTKFYEMTRFSLTSMITITFYCPTQIFD